MKRYFLYFVNVVLALNLLLEINRYFYPIPAWYTELKTLTRNVRGEDDAFIPYLGFFPGGMKNAFKNKYPKVLWRFRYDMETYDSTRKLIEYSKKFVTGYNNSKALVKRSGGPIDTSVPEIEFLFPQPSDWCGKRR